MVHASIRFMLAVLMFGQELQFCRPSGADMVDYVCDLQSTAAAGGKPPKACL